MPRPKTNSKSRERQPLPLQSLVKAAVDVAKGVSRRRIISENDKLPERLVRELQRSGVGQVEFRKAFQAELEDAAAETLREYRTQLKAGRIPPSNLSISLGILTDKISGLNARAAVENINIAAMVQWQGPKTREEMLAILRGEAVTTPVLPSVGDTPKPISSSVLPPASATP